MSNDELEEIWEAQAPSAGFAERVVVAARRDRRPRRRIWLAGAAAVAAAVAFAWGARESVPERGDVTATRRIEVAIDGGRAVAVLEPGARVTWEAATVVQDRGEVFYRVEPGAPFRVRTPTAEVSVLGTCFRISVEQHEENLMKKRDVIAAAVGAVTAVAVVIGVYEGRVQVSRADQAVTVGAGEKAIADVRGVRSAAIGPASAAAASDGATTDELRDRLGVLAREKAELEGRLATSEAAGAKHPYDLGPAEWAELAARGEFRYRMPCHDPAQFRPSAADLARLGLDERDGDAIQAAYQRATARFGTRMREICAGSETEIGKCISNLFKGLYAEDGVARATYAQVAEIRAGKRAEPPATELTPAARMLLEMSGVATPFEADLAETFGADEAHRIAFSNALCFTANTLR